METGALTDAELTHFGIRFEDEGLHPFDPTEEWWNESWFWDWFDDAGELAGHCRIGLHPVQKRAWAWLFLYHQGEWVAVEETRLPLGDVQLPRSTSRTRSSPRVPRSTAVPSSAYLRTTAAHPCSAGPS